MKPKRVILVLVRSMLGAVEWILPVCNQLKDTGPKTDIVFLFLRNNKNEIFEDNIFVEELISEITQDRYFDLRFIYSLGGLIFGYEPINNKDFFARILNFSNKFFYRFIKKIFKKRLFIRFIKGIKPDICLTDNSVFVDQLKNLGIKTGFFLTAPSYSFDKSLWVNFDKLSLNWKQKRLKHDFYLLDSMHTCSFFKNVIEEGEVFNVGTPKFDEEWINFLLHKKKHQKDCDYILVLLKNESSALFNDMSFKDLFSEILSACVSMKDMKIIIKPHPRQDLQLVRSIISQFKDADISISKQSSYSLIKEASRIISMPSGIIFDVLIMNRDVIEYFNYSQYNSLLKSRHGRITHDALGGMSYLDENGDLTSVFRGRNFVMPADTPRELHECLTHYPAANDFKRNRGIRNDFPDGSTERAVNVIDRYSL